MEKKSKQRAQRKRFGYCRITFFATNMHPQPHITTALPGHWNGAIEGISFLKS